MGIRTKYTIAEYAPQKNDASKGVQAGMWAVVRVRSEDIAFADTRGQAENIKQALSKSDSSSVDDDSLW